MNYYWVSAWFFLSCLLFIAFSTPCFGCLMLWDPSHYESWKYGDVFYWFKPWFSRVLHGRRAGFFSIKWKTIIILSISKRVAEIGHQGRYKTKKISSHPLRKGGVWLLSSIRPIHTWAFLNDLLNTCRKPAEHLLNASWTPAERLKYLGLNFGLMFFMRLLCLFNR